MDGATVGMLGQAIVPRGHVNRVAFGERFRQLAGDHEHAGCVVGVQRHRPTTLVDVEARAVRVHYPHDRFALAGLHMENAVHGVVDVRFCHARDGAQALFDAGLVHLVDGRANYRPGTFDHFLPQGIRINEMHPASHVQFHGDITDGHAPAVLLHEAQRGDHGTACEDLRRDTQDMLRLAHS